MPLLINTLNYTNVRQEIQANADFISSVRLLADIYGVIQTAFDRNEITAPHRDFLRRIANIIVTDRNFLFVSEIRLINLCVNTVGNSYHQSINLINSLVEQFLLPPNDIGNMILSGIFPIVDPYVHAATADYIQRCLNVWTIYNRILPLLITGLRVNLILVLNEMSQRNEN